MEDLGQVSQFVKTAMGIQAYPKLYGGELKMIDAVPFKMLKKTK